MAILTVRQLILELLNKGDLDNAVCITQGNSYPDLLITDVDDSGLFGLLNLKISPISPDFHSFIKTSAGKDQLSSQGFLRETEKDHWGGYDSTIEDFLKFILEKEIPLSTKMTVPLE